MPQAVDNLTPVLEELSEQLRNLERRVAALEGHAEKSSSTDLQTASIALERPRPPAIWHGFPPLESPSAFVTVLGKAVLGMAGAYLLRALAESSAIPKLPVLFVAILYACFWMVWATRIHAASRFASVTYAITSALILSPMLWESTVRFKALPPAIAASVTALFVMLAISLTWRKDLQFIPWVATLASVATVFALIIETHELIALTAALLVVAMITEVVACLGHRPTFRAIPALAADFAVWLLVFILASEGTIPEGYHPASARTIVFLCLVLLTIYGGSVGVRSFVAHAPITVFETAQAILAFGLATYGAMRATHGSIAPFLGIGFLSLASACYWGTLWRFADEAHARNRWVSATWAAALLLAGTFLLFPENLQIILFALAAPATTFFYSRTRKLSLGMHASLYLAAAVFVSRLLIFAADAFAGDLPATPDGRIALVAASGLICYLLGSRVTEEKRNRRMLWLIPGAVVAFAAAGLAVTAVLRISSSRFEGAPATLSVVRTIVNCVLALALAFLGSRWKRVELGWLAYAAVAFGTLKLLFEDLRFGNASSLVVSLLFYGLVLIFLPRVMRQSGNTS